MEMDLGVWEGMFYSDIQKKYPEQYYNFWQEPDKYRPVNRKGELFCQLKSRAVFTIRSLAKIHSNDEIIVVTHGAFLKTLISFFMQKALSEVWNGFPVNTGSRTIVEMNKHTSCIILPGDVSHLNSN